MLSSSWNTRCELILLAKLFYTVSNIVLLVATCCDINRLTLIAILLLLVNDVGVLCCVKQINKTIFKLTSCTMTKVYSIAYFNITNALYMSMYTKSIIMLKVSITKNMS